MATKVYRQTIRAAEKTQPEYVRAMRKAKKEGRSYNYAYDLCRKSKTPILTSRKEIMKIAGEVRNYPDVPIKIRKFKPQEYREGLAKDTLGVAWLRVKTKDVMQGKRKAEHEVVLHPILQYRPPKFVRDVARHEFSHVKVQKAKVGKESYWQGMRKKAKRLYG